ncbi:MAG: very short patch repair endonuclease [Beijerinckiaceae bacterium]|nr:very short patch repair endonuclease [Beijerinckiaceae bacterium]
MNDIVDRETRSRMMAGIKGKNTGPELMLRRLLHQAGFRYRIHPKNLPGKPDIVLPRYRAAVFVHGCFWHRHPGCRYSTVPSSNTEFWNAKFAANVTRDAKKERALIAAGWRVAVVWECELKRDAVGLTASVVNWLVSRP